MASADLWIWLSLVVAHLAPWLIGYLVVWQLFRFSGAGSRPLLLGLGGAAAPPLCAASLWLLDALGQPLTMGNALLAAFSLGLLLLLMSHVLARLRSASPAVGVPGANASRFDAWKVARIAAWILMALIALRLLSLLVDVTQRPLFPWDAWKIWAWKARVWFESGALLPFAPSGKWASAPADQYVIEGVNHPGFVSLVILWSATAVGDWNDRLIGLPWFLVGIWSALLSWGILRFLGQPKLLCWLAVYLLLSLPLVNAHMALFGYADLWMMFHFLVFSVGFLLWVREPRWGSMSIMVSAMALMSLTKDTGVYWLPALVLAVLSTRLPDRILLPAFGIMVILAALFVWLGFDPVALLSSGRYQISSQSISEVILAIGKHMFVWLDWHLLWYLMPFVMLLAFRLRYRSQLLRATLLLGVIVLCTMIAGFVGTRAAEYAMIGTLFGRVLLATVPVFVLLLCLTAWESCQASGFLDSVDRGRRI